MLPDSMPENKNETPRARATRVPARQEPQRQRAQRMKTLAALANGIATDVSDLFHSVKASLRMSRADLPDEHIVQDYLDQTLQGLGEAEDLVSQLLALSQMNDTAVQERMDLVPPVKEVLSLAASSFPNGFTLRTRFDETCAVMGNRMQLQQLVADLVTNAGQSMAGKWDEHPTVLDVSVQRVTADPDLAEQYLHLDPGQYVHLAVSDTGEGVVPDGGEPSDESAAAAAEEPPDAGLSPSIAHDIVEAHDGTLTVRHEPGEGTTFNVYLPLATEAESSSPDEPEPLPAETDRHVLVVDDDETVRTLEDIRLSRLGCEVTRAADAQEALEAVQKDAQAFDVALIDYHMPDMNGLELMHALRERECGASVALMTGLSAQISEAKARIVGIDRLLRKPVESHELNELLTQIG